MNTFHSQFDNIRALHERNWRMNRSRVALVCEGKTITYGDLYDRSFRLANSFSALGLPHQCRVAVLGQNSSAYVEIYTACEITGKIVVPINYRLSALEIAHLIADSAPEVLFFDHQYFELVDVVRSNATSIRHFIMIDEGDQRAAEWVSAYEAVLASEPAVIPDASATSDDIAYVMYTSGTTGLPKGAMLGHVEQVNMAQTTALSFSIRPSDRFLLVMPLFHVGAKRTQLAYFLLGATLYLHKSYDISQIAADIERFGITGAHLAPIMLQDLLNVPDLADRDHSSLRLVVYASAPIPEAQLRKAIATYGSIFLQAYSMTESGPGTILYPEDHLIDGMPKEQKRLTSAGRASVGSAIKIIDSCGNACEPENIGEICLYSNSGMRGYWNNNTATIETISSGWIRTGDVGYVDDEGYLFILDRKKDMIISGGENIYSREVEDALASHPDVAEVAVIGVPDERWGEAVKAIVVSNDRFLSEQELIDHCRMKIGSYKKPKTVEFVEALPRLANGKVDKKAIRKKYWGDARRMVN